MTDHFHPPNSARLLHEDPPALLGHLVDSHPDLLPLLGLKSVTDAVDAGRAVEAHADAHGVRIVAHMAVPPSLVGPTPPRKPEDVTTAAKSWGVELYDAHAAARYGITWDRLAELRAEHGAATAGARTIDPDRPCDHPDFVARVEIYRTTEAEDGPVAGFRASVWVNCSACQEPFGWTGLPAGDSPAHPTVSVDETELRAPLRPRSADPDFGMGLPGFSVRVHEPEASVADVMEALEGYPWPDPYVVSGSHMEDLIDTLKLHGLAVVRRA